MKRICSPTKPLPILVALVAVLLASSMLATGTLAQIKIHS